MTVNEAAGGEEFKGDIYGDGAQVYEEQTVRVDLYWTIVDVCGLGKCMRVDEAAAERMSKAVSRGDRAQVHKEQTVRVGLYCFITLAYFTAYLCIDGCLEYRLASSERTGRLDHLS